jgi:hypothetical protein
MGIEGGQAEDLTSERLQLFALYFQYCFMYTSNVRMFLAYRCSPAAYAPYS